MNKILCTFILSFIALNAVAADPKAAVGGPTVKKSTSGICHERNSRFYAKVKRFTPYDNLKACVDGGGHAPVKKSKA